MQDLNPGHSGPKASASGRLPGAGCLPAASCRSGVTDRTREMHLMMEGRLETKGFKHLGYCSSFLVECCSEVLSLPAVPGLWVSLGHSVS